MKIDVKWRTQRFPKICFLRKHQPHIGSIQSLVEFQIKSLLEGRIAMRKRSVCLTSAVIALKKLKKFCLVHAYT